MVLHSRKSTRIPGYDYSSENYYFVTICTHEKKCIFGTVGKQSEWGKIAHQELERVQTHFPNLRIDNFIVMPNHIHAIIVMDGKTSVSLNHVVGLYKSGVTRKIRQGRQDIKIWQRSYHDRIIRSQKEYEKIWQYIQYNDKKWEQDCFYCAQENDR